MVAVKLINYINAATNCDIVKVDVLYSTFTAQVKCPIHLRDSVVVYEKIYCHFMIHDKPLD